MEDKDKILKIVGRRNLAPKELEKILKSVENTKRPKNAIPYKDYIKGNEESIGIMSDTHIGEKYFNEDLFKHAGEVFRSRKVKRVYHAGDVLEGMSGRDGHVYELSQIGFGNQAQYAEDIFKKYMKGLKIFAINGNHDDWYMKKNNGGVDVCEELEKRIDNFESLGTYEADVQLGKGLTMKLFHPGDGTAYATSYKLQKLIESFDGGSKPQIVVEGHYHKALYTFIRNVHGFEAGTLCAQTSWMRGKKIPAHQGFWILTIGKSGGRKGGVGYIKPEFYPAYD